ncbi:hypothetical protein PFISCL1PPCAC_13200 [Pristionchus fissidentatus]|uniref:Nuclear receptor n=1 Tax=Pristionchus fissidentatus TaxID=1538716 RepID=A0AAV5VQY8_9BILA|nr:hypothetical protein PFISCL1PPCAC_13200 [Pristionchus fissidentatus]
MDSQRQSRACLVCCAPTITLNLGLDICGACSSFFRRVRASGKQFPCRRGDGQCGAASDGKFLCRRCRLDRCLALGLEFVAPSRNGIKTPESTTPMLDRIGQEWKSFIERRRVQELALAKASGWKNRIEHPTEEIYGVQMDCCHIVFNMLVAETFTLFKNIFPAFRDISFKEQECIFKDYIGKITTIDSYYRSRQLFGDTSRYMMQSAVTCVDQDLLSTATIQGNEQADLLISSARIFIRDQNEIVLAMFNRAKITEKELYALIALLMSELDSACDASEAALAIIDRHRADLLCELQHYYHKELRLADFSTRLGNLMSLNHAIQENKSQLKVHFRFQVTFFDVYTANEALQKLLL